MTGEEGWWKKGSPPQYALLIRERKGNKALRLLAGKTNGMAAAAIVAVVVIPEGPTSFLYIYMYIYINNDRSLNLSTGNTMFPFPRRPFYTIFFLYRTNSAGRRQPTYPIVFSFQSPRPFRPWSIEIYIIIHQYTSCNGEQNTDIVVDYIKRELRH